MGNRTGWVITGCLLAVTACQDATAPTTSRTRVPPNASVTPASYTIFIDGEEYPRFQDESQVPPDWCIPRINWTMATAEWSGSQAIGTGYMEYCGNYGEVTLALRVTGNGYDAGPPLAIRRDKHVLPALRGLYNGDVPWEAPGTCGYIANVATQNTARLLIFFDFRGLTEIGGVSYPDGGGKAQPKCTSRCDGDTRLIDDPEYDPYQDGDDGGSGCDDGGGGGGESDGGTQYYPGDYTGGETVNWSTGVGNGGSSVCGSAAVVDHVCIDYWDEASGSWKEWSCGYATTC